MAKISGVRHGFIEAASPVSRIGIFKYFSRLPEFLINLVPHIEKNPTVENNYLLILTLSYEKTESDELYATCLSFRDVEFEIDLGNIPVYQVTPLKGQILQLENVQPAQ